MVFGYWFACYVWEDQFVFDVVVPDYFGCAVVDIIMYFRLINLVIETLKPIHVHCNQWIQVLFIKGSLVIIAVPEWLAHGFLDFLVVLAALISLFIE